MTFTGFGASAKRKEDPALLRGEGQFVDDIHLPGMLHAAFVRSPYAHAKINSIDSSKALAIPGVLAPSIFFGGLVAVFGNLTDTGVYPTDSFASWIIAVSLLQGAGFTGAATGVNLARDIEVGLFDRFLASPAFIPHGPASFTSNAMLAAASAVGARSPRVMRKIGASSCCGWATVPSSAVSAAKSKPNTPSSLLISQRSPKRINQPSAGISGQRICAPSSAKV